MGLKAYFRSLRCIPNDTLSMKHLLHFPLFASLLSISVCGQTTIDMERSGGVYLVPCKLNGLELKFIFDTGASDVSISLSEANFMLKNGYLYENDIKGTEKYMIASGDIQEGTIINIRRMELGDFVLQNVSASVVHTMSAPLLLGQSAISRFASFTVDYQTNTLSLGALNAGGTAQSVVQNGSEIYAIDIGRIRIGESLLSERHSQLLREAYVRMLWEIRASHILIALPENPTAADTLTAWKKITSLRKRLMNGEDFSTVASGPGGSEDPSFSKNGGDLGYFSVLQMVYPFESAAYATPVGHISQPVRSRFGYHILKVLDRRTARGNVKVAHILQISSEQGTVEEQVAAEMRIREIHARLTNSEFTFSEAALRFSEDESSNTKGGELPSFGTGKMIEEFEDAAFGLYQVGDVSLPFKTRFGWHIAMLLERHPIPDFKMSKET